jgi:HDOD domain
MREHVDATTTRILERAHRHVTDYWIPMTAGLKERILLNFQDGTYQRDIDLLLADIKSDYSLFIACLGELKTLVELSSEIDDGISQDGILAPLRALAPEVLEDFVINLLDRSHSHDLESASFAQTARFQETFMSAGAAQELARSTQLDSEMACATALVRQLGYALIAWNYPTAYEEAMNALGEGDQLDFETALTQRLGFSPQMLAMRVVRDWGLPADLEIALKDSFHPLFEEASVTTAAAASYGAICRISETLARANNPEVYPSAKSDWKVASREIERRLGRRGMDRIRAAFAHMCREYVSALPSIFRAGLVLDSDFSKDALAHIGTIEGNPYLPHCEVLIQKSLEHLYEAMQKNLDSQHAIKQLVREIIPTARFSGGYVFTPDPHYRSLTARLEIGCPELGLEKGVELNRPDASEHTAAEAFRSETPIVVKANPEERMFFASIAAPLGTTQRLGVLYLEIPQAVFANNPAQHTTHFKAICHALHDCLSRDKVR